MSVPEKRKVPLIKKIVDAIPSRLKIIIGVAAVLLGIVIIVVSQIQVYNATKSRIINLRMEDIGQLDTQAAYFRNVQVISSSRELFGVVIPFTQSKYIYSYDGVVKAGIDFTKVIPSIDSINRLIHISMPGATITDVDVDENSLEIYDETKNIFTPLSLEDIQSARVKMEEEAQIQAEANGILNAATENAKKLIEAFLLSQEELHDYKFVWEIQ